MKKAVCLLISLLILSMVPWTGASEISKFHIKVGEPLELDIPGAHILYDGSEFSYSSRDGWCADLTVKFTETGNVHSVGACEVGFVDADGKYRWFLRNFEETDNPQEIKLGLFEEWNQIEVRAIDPIQGAVTVKDTYKGKTLYFKIGTKIEIKDRSTNARTVLELKNIETSLLGSKAVFVWHEYKVYEADVVVEEYQEQQPSPSSAPPQANQTNATTPGMLDPTKIMTAMIVVGENAAGADVAAGAKVAIAVQKWVDIVKEKSGDVVIPGLGGLGTKLATIASKNLNADAMLDTEVTDPGKIGFVVYSVGGPAANRYSAMLNSRTDLPVRFVKENGKWYLVSKSGEKWSGSYGVIMIIPAVRDVDEFKENFMKGNFKIMDVLVAGLDRWGTYAACDLLKGEFLKPVKDIQPDKNFMSLVQLQAQILTMFADPFSIFEVGFDPTKLPITAIIVDKDGKIVKVVMG
jgi:hypothetical protein